MNLRKSELKDDLKAHWQNKVNEFLDYYMELKFVKKDKDYHLTKFLNSEGRGFGIIDTNNPFIKPFHEIIIPYDILHEIHVPGQLYRI